MEDRLIPISDAYQHIGFRKSKVYRFIADGKLQALKIGSRTFLKKSEIDRFLNENSTPFGNSVNQPSNQVAA